MKKYYMHTIGNSPAYYAQKEQIVYMGQSTSRNNILAKSLNQIKLEQRLSSAWRGKNGYSSSNDYNYVIVRTP